MKREAGKNEPVHGVAKLKERRIDAHTRTLRQSKRSRISGSIAFCSNVCLFPTSNHSPTFLFESCDRMSAYLTDDNLRGAYLDHLMTTMNVPSPDLLLMAD
jgi:hypothetical protein